MSMASAIVISDESDSGTKADISLIRWHRARRKIPGHILGEDSSTPKIKRCHQDIIIDLTENNYNYNMENISGSDNEVIDLTEDINETFIKTSPVSSEWNYGSSDSDSELMSAEELCCSDQKLIKYLTTDDDCSVTGHNSVSSGSTRVNSDIDSLDSLTSPLVGQSNSPGRSKDEYCKPSESNTVKLNLEVPALHSFISTLNKTPQSDFSTKCSAAAFQIYPSDNSNSLLLSPINTQQADLVSKEEPSFNKASLYKLRCYRNPPVHHLFFHRLKQNEETRKKLKITPQQIPSRRMNFVESTMEENFPQGTLHFLNEFVSIHHYPKISVLRHVVSDFLLGSEESGIRNDAYTFLMKVQRLHPANQHTVPWDWESLSKAMENKEQPVLCLFLQYVVQTLEDDFQLCVHRRNLHTCLSKVMISCDTKFSNIRHVINWLIKTMNDSSHITPEMEDSAGCDNQRIMCLLQRMLSIAVEVDLSPSCSSSRIADSVFPDVICLTSRHEREMFLSSIESALLRAKVIEVILQHSCPERKDLSLSVAKILYFLVNSKLLLGKQVRRSPYHKSTKKINKTLIKPNGIVLHPVRIIYILVGINYKVLFYYYREKKKISFKILNYLIIIKSMGDRLSVIKSFLNNGFPDKGSHT
ncbi:hypothetical protein XENTR_v10008320 [Xenopus tropicalis]|nr:hypothetical protein XENTR_v10008320 [Xenopus tropicalis]KAE8614810.1 hypothetical protein XENTR_v10008320 [Xenopus tropicalis]